MFPPFLYVRDINLKSEGIITSAFTTVKAKAPKLFQVYLELLMLHVDCWQHYLVYLSLVRDLYPL
jgi:hypothetical protein